MMEECSNCNRPSYIENRKRMLCQGCNYFRRHGVTLQEANQKKQKEYQVKQQEKQQQKQGKQVIFKVVPIKQSTDKQNVITRLLSELKKLIRKEAQESDMNYCWGCGTTDTMHLDCSHIISVKHRKDLELDRDNINLFCRICHLAWECLDKEKVLKMFTLQKDLDYLKTHDNTIYQKTLIRLEIKN